MWMSLVYNIKDKKNKYYIPCIHDIVEFKGILFLLSFS